MDSAGIRQYELGSVEQCKKVAVPERLEVTNSRGRTFDQVLELLAGARMDREESRYVAADYFESLHDGSQAVGSVHIAGTVQREHCILIGKQQAVCQYRVAVTSTGENPLQGIDHDIADQMYLRPGYTFLSQILVSVGARCEEPGGDPVGHKPVDFFGHGPVVGT